MRYSKICSLLLPALALALPLASKAVALDFIDYPDFASATGLHLNGSAVADAKDDGKAVLQLTDLGGFEAGSAFVTRQLYVGSFASKFSFRVHGGNADGLAFVVQNDPAGDAALGGTGSALGYYGIQNSIAVEFDDFHGLACIVEVGQGGCGFDGASLATAAYGPEIGTVWNVWIEYNGTTLSVSYSTSTTKPSKPNLTAALNIPQVVGSSSAYVGFTGGEGEGVNYHDIYSWCYFALQL
jgi:hypothetical protein